MTDYRNEFTKLERGLYEGNLKLLNENKEMLKDINILIRYIKGDKELKPYVINIVKYYKKFCYGNEGRRF